MQMSSTSWGVATLEEALVTSVTLLALGDSLGRFEASARGQPEPPGPVGGGHLGAPERLYLVQPDGGGGGADQDLSLAHPQLPGCQLGCAVDDSHRAELDPQ